MHPEVGTGADQRLLDRPHVIDHVDRLAEPDNRVPDELPGAVPGDLAAAVDVDHRGSRVAGRPVELLGPLAGRVDGRVLEQQAGVRDVAAHPPLVQVPLQVPGLLVGDRIRTEAGPGEYQLALHATSLDPYRHGPGCVIGPACGHAWGRRPVWRGFPIIGEGRPARVRRGRAEADEPEGARQAHAGAGVPGHAAAGERGQPAAAQAVPDRDDCVLRGPCRVDRRARGDAAAVLPGRRLARRVGRLRRR